jgi:hypothetical protein
MATGQDKARKIRDNQQGKDRGKAHDPIKKTPRRPRGAN